MEVTLPAGGASFAVTIVSFVASTACSIYWASCSTVVQGLASALYTDCAIAVVSDGTDGTVLSVTIVSRIAHAFHWVFLDFWKTLPGVWYHSVLIADCAHLAFVAVAIVSWQARTHCWIFLAPCRTVRNNFCIEITTSPAIISISIVSHIALTCEAHDCASRTSMNHLSIRARTEQGVYPHCTPLYFFSLPFSHFSLHPVSPPKP